MMNSSSRAVALTNLQWKIAHGVIGLKILKDKGETTPFLHDLEKACDVAANGKGLNGLLSSILLSPEDFKRVSDMLLQTKKLVEQCTKSRDGKSLESAIAETENLYSYIEGLAHNPPLMQVAA